MHTQSTGPSRAPWYATAGLAVLALGTSLLFPMTSPPASADPSGLPATTRVPYPTDGSLPPWTLPGGYTWCSAMGGPGYEQAVYVQPGYACPPTGVPTTTPTTSTPTSPIGSGQAPNLPQTPNPPFAGIGAPNGKSWNYGVDTLGPPAGRGTVVAQAPR
ncbi:hypothetical protein ACLQ3K_21560 [Tsukamurella sp. DT100]|uniref:hypothetical protein n=1 Tax=Tsukamurella sp. DT100 TaxID=3393415 RepID=UPI003CF0FA97